MPIKLNATGSNALSISPIAGKYTISEVKLPIPYWMLSSPFGHNLWVLKDPNGQVVAELDGLATDKNGVISTIGSTSSDKLFTYEYSAAESKYYDPSYLQSVVITGSYSTIMTRWNAATQCGGAINSEVLSYPKWGLGKNSNSVASTLGVCMGVGDAPGIIANNYAPGIGSLLLPPGVIGGIQNSTGVVLAFNVSFTPYIPEPSGDLLLTGDSSSLSFRYADFTTFNSVSSDNVLGLKWTDANGVVVNASFVPQQASPPATPNQISMDYSQFSSTFGSTLGRLIGGANLVIGVAVGSILGAASLSIGQQLFHINYFPNANAAGNATTGTGSVWADFGSNLQSFGVNAAVGSASSFLAAQFAQSVGLNGFAGQLFSTVGGNSLGYLATSLAAGTPVGNFLGIAAPGGFGNSITGGIASFIGTELASLVVQPHTVAEATLSSLGAAVGSIALGSIGFAADAFFSEFFLASTSFGPIGLAVGAFVGFILGDLIGSLFGHHHPRIPTASADVVLQIPIARYALGSEVSANGGDLQLADAMAKTARDTLNGLIGQITHGAMPAYVSNLTSPTVDYGINGQKIYYKLGGSGGTEMDVTSADQAVDAGVLWALPQTRIIGGDIVLKRAVQNGTRQTVTELLGDLQIAADYEQYLKIKPVVDAAIGASWNSLSAGDQAFYTANKAFMTRAISMTQLPLTGGDPGFYAANKAQVDRIIGSISVSSFAAGWIVTLARAAELKLDQFSASDFYGGLQGFLQSFGVGATGSGPHFEDVTAAGPGVGPSGSTLTVAIGGPSAAGTFSLLPQASPDGTSVAIANIAAVGYIAQYSGTTTNANEVSSAAGSNTPITVGPGSGPIYNYYFGIYAPGTNGGDDIITGSNAGDNISAGAGNVWIDGGAGNDVIYGGPGRDVLLGGVGDDTITAGSGDTYLAGGAGNDTLVGGAGNDTFVGGSGSNHETGGTGNDTFFIAQHAPGESDTIDGRGGSNTVSFERRTTGVTFALSGAAGQAFNNDSYTNIQNVTGSQFADTLTAAPGGSTLMGLADNDTLIGGSGNDTLEGGAGADALWGGYGNNTASSAHSSAGVYVSINNPALAFDAAYYLANNPDVAASGINPLSHYETLGWKEGRNPNAAFNTNYYLSTYPDVKAAGLNPFDHFRIAGFQENRSTSATVPTFNGVAIGGDATGDTLHGIDNLTGSASNDELQGDALTNVINAGGGDDWIDATAGPDTYNGEVGFDTVDYSQTAFVAIPGTFAINVALGANNSGTATYHNSDGSAATQTLTSIEQVVGTGSSDIFSSRPSNSNVTWDGDGGPDLFYGGTGSDTYVLGHNYGVSNVYDGKDASNTVKFKAGVTFDNLWASGAGGTLSFGIRGEASTINVNSDFATTGNDVVKTLDLAGSAQVDLTQINASSIGTDAADTVYGSPTTSNLMFGFGGNDNIYAAIIGNNFTGYSLLGSVIDGGLGNDNIVTSVGDDQFLFERGDGQDTINDGGGKNTIVFGPTVGANDVIYQVVGYDLYVGLKDLTNPNLTASQVSDSMRIVNGGVIRYDLDTDKSSSVTDFSVEAGGVTTDLTKANIAWAYKYYHSGGGGGPLPPVVFDLTGDGLEITPVAQSNIVTKDTNGNLLRTSWVGPTNGILAYDRNGDGKINNTSDISFIGDKLGAKTDLEGLAGWDTNGNGILDAHDKNWNKLLVWVDANQDGVAEKGEIKTLAQIGIVSINLTPKPTGFDGSDNIDTVVSNTTTFTRFNGSVGTAYDVSLAREQLSGNLTTDLSTADLNASAVQIGHLLNNPIAAATASGLTNEKATPSAVASFASVDFTGSDKPLSSADAARWSYYLDPTTRAVLPGQIANGIGAENLALIRSTTDVSNDGSALIGRGIRDPGTRLQALVVDFNHNGPDLIAPLTSSALVDVNRSGSPTAIGWVKPSDGVFVYDRNGDGSVDTSNEISFQGDVPNAKTSLQGLGAFDTNHDGALSAADSSFARFLIWRDLNGNGVSDPGELQSLAQAGVQSIALSTAKAHPAFGTSATNDVLGVSSVTFADGSSRALYDVALGFADSAAKASPPIATTKPTSGSDIASGTASSSTGAVPGASGGSSPATTAPASLASSETNVGVSRGSLDGPAGTVVEDNAAASGDMQWWRDPSVVGRSLASLASGFQSTDTSLGSNAASFAGAGTPDAATLQRLMLLRQNIASLTAGAGGGTAAIWARGAANDFVAGLAAGAHRAGGSVPLRAAVGG